MRQSEISATDNASKGRFIALWTLVLAIKLALAAVLPLFVDEAFYWQEGRHLAWAYSDLPGLTAWLTRLGGELFGHSAWALRLPFLVVAATVPWLVMVPTRREFGHQAGWQAGSYALLLPLAGTLGVLALPDAIMALATVLCMDAGARLLRKVDATTAVELAFGLALGALSHYRFIAVIVVGFVALLALREGRRALRDARVWIAIAFGASAWTPLIAWNMRNAEAGLRFQLVDRHPWAFHWDGIWFIVIQAVLVTPLLLAALAAVAWRARGAQNPVARYFALLGSLVIIGFFVLGFFADTQRVSFHWPLPGYIALLPLLPQLLRSWPCWLRRMLAATAGLGLFAMLGYYAVVSQPQLRERSASSRWYPANFSGWDELADAVRQEQARLPTNTRLLAGSFKVGAELGFALNEPRIAVLPHPLNDNHGRAPQLRLWGLQARAASSATSYPRLVVIGATDVPYKEQLSYYHALCRQLGPLPPPRVINVDHGRQRFLLFVLPATGAHSILPGPACVAPAMAWIDHPLIGAAVGRRFDVTGWAFKEGVGIANVDVTLDGIVIARARYGLPSPGTQAYWGNSSDPRHPNVGFTAQVQLPDSVAHGLHWLGLRLYGADGSVEDWSQQPLRIGNSKPN